MSLQPRFSELDLSIKLTNDEIRNLLNRTKGQDQDHDASRINYSYNTTVFNDTHQLMDATLAAERSNAKHRADALFATFLDVVKGRKSNLDFDTVQELVQTCTDILDEVARHADTRRGAKEKEQLGWLQTERDVWRLVYSLYRDRLLIQKEGMDCDDLDLMRSEKTIAEYLYLNNSVLREYQLIVDWLELCASEQFFAQVGHFTDRTVGWENTLHSFHNPAKNVFNANRNMVRSLDPDAPIREQRALHDLDQEDQSRLLRAIFTKIRQGKVDEAQNLCEHCGHPWQAAILEGWRLSHDPNYGTDHQTQKMPLEGNAHRDIWKKCAWLKADSRNCDDYSRAIAAVFCGHLQALTNVVVCPAWTDLLWAHFKVQIDIRVEFEVRQCSMRSYHAMPEEYWNNKRSLEQIFDELAASKSETVRGQAQQKMNVIVQYLVLDDVNGLMALIAGWLSQETINAHMLRFLAHLVLFLRQMDRLQARSEVGNRVLRAYVEHLIEMHDPQLVAFYTSTLPKEAQVILFSQFLEKIEGTEERRAALEEALVAGLNVDRIAQYTVQVVREREMREDQQGDQRKKKGELTEADEKKISVLEYLQFYPQHRAELLFQANALIRQFLAKEKLECVRKVLQNVPQDSVRVISEMYGHGGGRGQDMPYREECSIKENICHTAYLSAVDGFNQWTHLFHNEPKAPSQSERAMQNFTEKMAFELKEQEYLQQLDVWRGQVEEQKKIATGLLYNVLLFPDQGWLVDPEGQLEEEDEDEDEEWANRVTQMQGLRSICVPEVVILLHKCLHLSKDYQECVQLVDEVASENRKLYKCYPAHKLSELLAIVAESSLALLNEKCDPWGYSNI